MLVGMPGAPSPAVIRLDLGTSAKQRQQLLDCLAQEGVGTPAIRKLAAQAVGEAQINSRLHRDVSYREHLAAAALRLVQQRPYIPPRQDVEEFQSVWSIGRPGVGGDCADLSVLLVSVYRTLGFPSEVIWITQAGKSLNHVTAKVWVDGAERWAEPTIRGARLGEYPYDAADRLRAWHSLGDPS